jgi:hypothetical protein
VGFEFRSRAQPGFQVWCGSERQPTHVSFSHLSLCPFSSTASLPLSLKINGKINIPGLDEQQQLRK